MKFAIISLFLGSVTAFFRILAPNFIDGQSYIDAFMMLSFAAMIGSVSFGANPRIDKASLEDRKINLDTISALIITVSPIALMQFSHTGSIKYFEIILLALAMGNHEALSSIFNFNRKFISFTALELFYAGCIITVFCGQSLLAALSLLLFGLHIANRETVRFIFQRKWNLRVRAAIGSATFVTYGLPLYFPIILSTNDAVSLLAAFSLSSVIGNISISIQQRISLAANIVSRKTAFFLAILTFFVSFALLNIGPQFQKLDHLSTGVIEAFSLSLFVGSRVLHTSSLLYDRLNLDGDTSLFRLQIQRLIAFLTILFAFYHLTNSVSILLMFLTAVNLTFSARLLLKK